MTIIEKALQRTTDTKALFLGPGVIVKTAQMFRELFPGKKGVVVADTNTFRVAGEQVDSILEESGLKAAEPFIFDDPDLFAEWGFACRLKEYLSGIDAIAVAVGSGVINDLTKYVSCSERYDPGSGNICPRAEGTCGLWICGPDSEDSCRSRLDDCRKHRC